MLHFEKCSVCPIAPDRDCHAQKTGAAHAYCKRIARGDPQARACVLSHSEPEPTAAPSVSQATPLVSEPTPLVTREAKPRIPLGTKLGGPDCIPCQARMESLEQT